MSSRPLSDGAIVIGSRLEPLVDRFLIEETRGAVRLELGTPVERELVFVHDRPWEGNRSGLATIIRDGAVCRMYYCGSQLDLHEGGYRIPHNYTCYAQSADGLAWSRPDLGLVELPGGEPNNVDDAAGGAGRRRPAPRGVLPVPVPGSLPHRRSPGITTAVPALAASPRPAVLRPAHHGGVAIARRGSLAAGDLPRLLQADAVLLPVPHRLGPRGGAHGRLRDALPQRLPGRLRAVAPPDHRCAAREAGLSRRGGGRRPGLHPQQRRRALPRAGSGVHLHRPRSGAVVGPRLAGQRDP